MATPGEKGKIKVAWIFGAGFSKPLRAPLFNELLTEPQLEWLKAAYKSTDEKIYTDAESVHAVYQKGFGKQWRHAETFLDIVSRMVSNDSPDQNLIAGMIGNPDDLLWFPAKVRRTVAAQCAHFLNGVRPHEDEDWLAFRDWARDLSDFDSIITFNYDCVLEKLSEWRSQQSDNRPEQGHFRFINPNRVDRSAIANSARSYMEMTATKRPSICKMHGSVSWIRESGDRISIGDSSDAAIRQLKDIAIGIPGRDKMELSGLQFRPIHDFARNAIAAAQKIVVIGYSFPSTDTAATSLIEKAIAGCLDHDVVEIILVNNDSKALTRISENFQSRLDDSRTLYVANGRRPKPNLVNKKGKKQVHIRLLEETTEDYISRIDRVNGRLY